MTNPNRPAVDVVSVLIRVMGWGRTMAQSVAQGMDAAVSKSVEGSYARGDREAVIAAASSTLTRIRQQAQAPEPMPDPNP